MTHARPALLRSLAIAFATAGALACSSGGGGAVAVTVEAGVDAGATDGAPGPGPTPTPGGTISAASGGTIRLEGATLAIPPGALAADTAISAQANPAAGYPGADSLRGKGYDFGPSGLVFAKPATLTVDVPAGVDGASLVLANLDEKTRTWVPLADSKLSGGAISGSIAHFSSYALLLVLGNANLTVDFSSCGAPISSKEGFYADTCGAGAVKGSMTGLKLAGAPGGPSAGKNCTVSYSFGKLTIATDLPGPGGGGGLTFVTHLDGDRDDNLLAASDTNGAPIRFVQMREVIPGVPEKVIRASFWLSEARGLNYVSASSVDGSITCGSDPRASN
jgi:hypothetical protein